MPRRARPIYNALAPATPRRRRIGPSTSTMIGFLNAVTLLALAAVAAGLGYVLGRRHGTARHAEDARLLRERAPAPADAARDQAAAKTPHDGEASGPIVHAHDCAAGAYASALAEDRVALFRALADARAETARYRQVVVDIERNALPPLFDAPGTPDDLKLVVGIGPAIERLLHQMGIGSYRQIARLTERDIDAIEARLSEFPGRVRRDGWVTQARALHAAKYGTPP